MKCTVEEVRTVTLVLTVEEAKWIKNMAQNDLSGNERELDRVIRESIFNGIQLIPTGQVNR